MPLSESQAKDWIEIVKKFRTSEEAKLKRIHDYLQDIQGHPAVPNGSSQEVQSLAKISRVPIMEIVVASVAQAMYVDGYRADKESDNDTAWDIWQANKLDAGQTGVHRATVTYGTSYVTVLPGEPKPVIRGYSPRFMTAIYEGDEIDWPVVALRVQALRGNKTEYRLYDKDGLYTFIADSNGGDLTGFSASLHNIGKTPVVRFLNQSDLDEDNDGEVEPLMALQDQVNLTTFELLVAQHYAAFKQKWAIGWTTESEDKLLKAGAARVWTFEDENVKVGEFAQTDLKGYLESRESSLRHAATLSQTPVHELIGQMINLSAEALVAAEAGQRRKITEKQMSMGESWEQVLKLAATIGGGKPNETAQVIWRDTESRALSATVDALGKMATMLSIPPEELWERIPNTSQQDIERWKAAKKEADALLQLNTMLNDQAAKEVPNQGDVNNAG